MSLRFYPRPELLAWLVLTTAGALVSLLSLREINAGIAAVEMVALERRHSEDVLSMARHNRVSEYARFVAQGLFWLVGVFALLSRPRVILGRARLVDQLLPWLLVGVEGILVGNSANEYLLSRRILKRRAARSVRRGEA